MSSKVKKNSTMIRVPNELKAELEELAAQMLQSYTEGRTTDVEITEQAGPGQRVALHEAEDARDLVAGHLVGGDDEHGGPREVALTGVGGQVG